MSSSDSEAAIIEVIARAHPLWDVLGSVEREVTRGRATRILAAALAAADRWDAEQGIRHVSHISLNKGLWEGRLTIF